MEGEKCGVGSIRNVGSRCRCCIRGRLLLATTRADRWARFTIHKSKENCRMFVIS